jgi:hypothetical protein
MPIASVVPPSPNKKDSQKSSRRARRDDPVVVANKPASGSVQQIKLTIPLAAPRAKKKSLLGALLGLRPKAPSNRGQVVASRNDVDRSRRVFIATEDFSIKPHIESAFEKGSGEYMGSMLAGTADAAGMAHFGHAMHMLEALDMVLMEAGYLRKPKLTPSQTSTLRRLAENNPAPAGTAPGVWITAGQAMDMDLPPAWYEDLNEIHQSRPIVPIETSARRLTAINEQRYAQSKAMANNKPHPV